MTGFSHRSREMLLQHWRALRWAVVAWRVWPGFSCGPRGSSRGRRNLNKRESFASRAMQERGVKVQKVQQDIDSERRPAP